MAALNIAGEHQYNYTDKDMMLPGVHVVYYRLKQKDIDERFSYSAIILVKLTGKMVINVYPNPAKDVLNIVDWDKIKKMELYDISGRKISEYRLPQAVVNVNNLLNGTYILKVTLKNGETLEQKIIVNR